MGEEGLYRMKITLRGSKPAIWRRFEVPAEVTLYQLHHILQVVMGWTDSHFHQFRRGNECYGPSDPEFASERVNERKVRLREVLRKTKDRMVYEYDFGDGWEHDLLLEAIGSVSPGSQMVKVLKGQGACPPEDVGGIGGYYDFLEAVSDRKHPSHRHMLEWCDGPFDTEAFDLAGINQALAKILRRRDA